jgi:hypothetical protein
VTGGGSGFPQDRPETLQDKGSTQIFELAVFTQAVPELLHCCSWALNPQVGGVGVITGPPQLEFALQIPDSQHFVGILIVPVVSVVYWQTYPSGCPTGLQYPEQISQCSLLVQIVAFIQHSVSLLHPQLGGGATQGPVGVGVRVGVGVGHENQSQLVPEHEELSGPETVP